MEPEYIDMLLGENPDISHLWSLLARKVFDDGEYERAIEYYIEAYSIITNKTERAFILSDIAECYEALGKAAEAEKYRIMLKNDLKQ